MIAMVDGFDAHMNRRGEAFRGQGFDPIWKPGEF
jgi:hypothetical protein